MNRIEKVDSIIAIADYHKHPDVLILGGDANVISINDVRRVSAFTVQKPIVHHEKVILIDQSELLSKEAQSAMLKVIEELPKYVRIVLEVDRKHNLIDTIISRSSIIDLGIASKALGSVSSDSLDDLSRIIDGDIRFCIDWLGAIKSTTRSDAELVNIIDGWEFILRKLLMNKINYVTYVTTEPESEFVSKSLSNKPNRVLNNLQMPRLIRILNDMNKTRMNMMNGNSNALLNLESLILSLSIPV